MNPIQRPGGRKEDSVMRNVLFVIAAIAILLLGSIASAQPYRAEKAGPLPDRVSITQLGQYRPTSVYKAAMIAWGADEAQILGDLEGIFKAEGVPVEFYLDNDLKRQVEAMARGELHFMRLTLGQAIMAAPLFERLGTDLVVIVQLSWSVGGDVILTRVKITSLKQIKTLAMMLDGPHPEYALKAIHDARGDLSKINIVWLQSLMACDPAPDGKVLSPYQAMEAASTIDAATVISPEAAKAEGPEGIPNTKARTSTKDTPYATADVYVARGDFYDSNRELCYKFFRASLKSQEALKDLDANQTREAARFAKVMEASGRKLLEIGDSEAARTEAALLLGDCKLAQHGGNRFFFTGKQGDGQSNSRNGRNLIKQILPLFIEVGISAPCSAEGFPIRFADWDFDEAGKGLKYADVVERRVFDTARTEKVLQERVNSELGSLDDLASLGSQEILFPPNEVNFDANDPKYAPVYQAVLELAQTHQGATILILGHTDPSMIAFLKKAGKVSAQELKKLEQDQNNDSTERAKAFREAVLAYAKANKIACEPSQFYAKGVGGSSPRVDPAKVIPIIEEAVRTKSQTKLDEAIKMAQPNRVVVFSVQQVDSELGSIKALLGN